MAMWPINLPQWPGQNFQRINPEKILMEYNGPITFTFRDAARNLMLAHLADADDEVTRYVVAPTSGNEIERLEKGTTSIRGALSQPLIWVIDVQSSSPDMAVISSWSGTISDLPDDAIPGANVMLSYAQAPLLRVRVPDTRYRHGAISADAVSALFEGAEAAIDILLRHVAPDERKNYRLEAQQLAFNSIEVAFQAVRERDLAAGESDTTLPAVQHLLSEGLRWASSGGAHELKDTEKAVVLDAIAKLAPKPGGRILMMELSGRAVDDNEGLISLDTNIQDRIDSAFNHEPKPPKIDRMGMIRELDKDKKTLHVRMPGEKEGQKFAFSEEFQEAIYTGFAKDEKVHVHGDLKGKTYYVTRIEKPAKKRKATA